MTDLKITQLTSASSISTTDLLPVVTGMGSVPLTQNITVESLLSGWIQFIDSTWSYASATTLTTAGDFSSYFPRGTKIKLTNSTVKYFYVVDCTYSAPNTTLTLTGGSDYSLAAAAVSDFYFSYSAVVNGFPTYFNFNPTINWTAGTAPSGTPTKTSVFSINGGVCTVNMYHYSYTAGATVTEANFTLPVTPSAPGGAVGLLTVSNAINGSFGMVYSTLGYIFCTSASINRLRFFASYPI